MDGFRLALALGAAAIIVLAIFRLFPLGLVASALLVPLLVVLYLWDVDVYEDEPLFVLALTIVWGAVAGVGAGFLAKSVVDVSASLTVSPSTHTLVWSGFLIPIISTALMIAGPLVLLPNRKFNDVLDGVTFGGACAVAFVGAELLTHSSTFLSAGVRPVGLVVPWVLRLIALGLIVPVLTACAIGAAAGTLWLRFRPAGDGRSVLGPFGRPLLAVPLAAALLVAAALIELYTRTWLQVFLLFLDALLALVWARQLIHLGLLDEASEIQIGPPVVCGNCGEQTPRHSFCASCGISLRALPKSLRTRGSGSHAESATKIGRGRFVLVFLGALGLFAGVALILMAILSPGQPQPPCQPGVPCPGISLASPPLITGRKWHSPLGLQVEIPARGLSDGSWKMAEQDDRHLRLTSNHVDLWIGVVPATQADPLKLVQGRVSALRTGIPTLAPDPHGYAQMTDPTIGSVDGIGSAYTGAADTGEATVEAMIMASTCGGVSVVVSALTTEPRSSEPQYTPWNSLIDADIVLNGVRWPSQPAPGGRQ